jgi:hypothetical protein
MVWCQDHIKKPKAKKGPKFKGMVKATQHQVLNTIYEIVESKNYPKNGKSPHGFLTQTIKEQKLAHSWLTRDMYNGYWKQCKIKEAAAAQVPTELPTDTGSNISSEKIHQRRQDIPKGQQRLQSVLTTNKSKISSMTSPWNMPN